MQHCVPCKPLKSMLDFSFEHNTKANPTGLTKNNKNKWDKWPSLSFCWAGSLWLQQSSVIRWSSQRNSAPFSGEHKLWHRGEERRTGLATWEKDHLRKKKKIQLLYINCTESESQQILIDLVRLLYWNMTLNKYRYFEWLFWDSLIVCHWKLLSQAKSNDKIVLHRKCVITETVPGTLNTHTHTHAHPLKDN